MKPATGTLLFFKFGWLCLIDARIFHSRDAITVEGEYGKDGADGREAITHLLPSATFSLTEKTCWTNAGEIGTCVNVRTCYPLFELAPLSQSADEVIKSVATCNYTLFETQVYGICCPLKPRRATAGEPSAPNNNNDEINKGTVQTGSNISSTAAPLYEENRDELPSVTTTSSAIQETTSKSPNVVDVTKANLTFSTSTTENHPSLTSVEEIDDITAITAQPEPMSFSCGMGPFKYLNADEQRRIVGGSLAMRNSWPFLVALLKNGRQFCGGSIIDPLRVLTAAHCIAQMSSWDVGRLEVAFGMHELKPDYQTLSSSPLVKVKVRKVTRHRGFNSRTLYNDIAIVTLDTPIEYSSFASPVCLPTNIEGSLNGKEAVVIGWGSLKEGGSQPSVLQQVTVQIQSNDECKRRYGKDAPGGIVDHMLCASYPGKDACSGDSGGPLIVQANPGAPWVQVGVVSWGIGCGKPPYPGVYTRVSYFLRWIEANIR